MNEITRENSFQVSRPTCHPCPQNVTTSSKSFRMSFVFSRCTVVNVSSTHKEILKLQSSSSSHAYPGVKSGFVQAQVIILGAQQRQRSVHGGRHNVNFHSHSHHHKYGQDQNLHISSTSTSSVINECLSGNENSCSQSQQTDLDALSIDPGQQHQKLNSPIHDLFLPDNHRNSSTNSNTNSSTNSSTNSNTNSSTNSSTNSNTNSSDNGSEQLQNNNNNNNNNNNKNKNSSNPIQIMLRSRKNSTESSSQDAEDDLAQTDIWMGNDEDEVLVNVGNILEVETFGKKKVVAVIEKQGKRKWLVKDQEGNLTLVTFKKVRCILDASLDLHVPVMQQLKDFVAAAHDIAKNTELLKLAWNLLDGTSTTPDHMANLVLNSNDPVDIYACHLLLSTRNVYFKHRKDRLFGRYESRSQLQVTELTVKEERRSDIVAQEDDIAMRVAEMLKAKDCSSLEGIDAQCFAELQSLALQADGKTRYSTAWITQDSNADKLTPSMEFASIVGKILKIFNKPQNAAGAFEVMVECGCFSYHENLFFRKSSMYPGTFSEKIEKEVTSILENPKSDPDAHCRKDLRHLLTFTIDSDDTFEIDDAFSYEYCEDDPENGKVWVHISDPSRWIDIHNPIAQEAVLRSSTIYLPTEKVTMLPTTLCRLFSLNPNEDLCALSIGFKVDNNGELVDTEICPSIIHVDYNLNYLKANDAIMDLTNKLGNDLRFIKTHTERHYAMRKRKGSIQIDLPSGTPVVSGDEDNPDIVIRLLEVDLHSWKLVSELMIMIGNVVGQYCDTNSIPVPFRGQELYDQSASLKWINIPEGYARSYHLLTALKRPETKFERIHHASLALDAYVQISSPIRRCGDLLTHFQLRSYMRGERVPLTKSEFQKYFNRIEFTGRLVKAIATKSNQYWILQYLRKHMDKTFHGVILRDFNKDLGLAVVLLVEIGYQTIVKANNYLLGDRVQVHIDYVNARLQKIVAHAKPCDS